MTAPHPEPKAPTPPEPVNGERVLAWCYEDYVAAGGRDIGDNSQFWLPATVERVYTYLSSGGHPDRVADVKFDHREQPSRALFLTSLRREPL